MALINGARIVTKVFESFGIDQTFTLSSGHLEGLYRSIDKDTNIKISDHRNEQAAGFAALGYAKTTGKIGVALIACGPGITNVVTPVAGAYTDAIPMLIIGGANPVRDFDTLPMNGFAASTDAHCKLMESITKWSIQIPHIARLADLLGLAIRRALSGRPGPVYVDLPQDILYAEIEESEVRYLNADVKAIPPVPAPEAVKFILDKLNKAERPLIGIGTAAVTSQCSAELVALAEKLDIPVMTNNKSRGAMPTNHPLWAKNLATMAAMAHRGYTPDVALIIGARFGLYTGGWRNDAIPKDTYIIQVDIDGGEFGRCHDANYSVVADAKQTLNALLEAANGMELADHSEWAQIVHETTNKGKTASLQLQGDKNGVVHPGDLAKIVASKVPDEAIVALCGGEAQVWGDAVFPSVGPNKCVAKGYLGNIGEGLPQAIGAKVAHPDELVVCYTGDGAVGYSFTEFETMARNHLPVLVVVSNNGSWGMCAHFSDLGYPDDGWHCAADFTNAIRYDLAAEGLGAHGEFCTKLDEIGPAMDRALEAVKNGKPALVNVVVDNDPSIIPPFTARACPHPAGYRDEKGRLYVPCSNGLFLDPPLSKD